MSFPVTQKMLVDWAGPSVFRDGQILFENGLVKEAEFEPPHIRGTILRAGRAMRTAARILPNGSAENACPCRDSTERGIICSHVIALGLALLHRQHDPQREPRREEERLRAQKLATIDESIYIRRAPPGTPDSVPAAIRLTLYREWREGWSRGCVPVTLEAEYEGARHPLDAVPRTTTFAFPRRDEAVLFVLEDIAGGPPGGTLTLSKFDFLNLLDLHEGRPFYEDGRSDPLEVMTPRLPSRLRIDLDTESGELVLNLHTEIPYGADETPPFHLAHDSKAWVFSNGRFWPLETLLPDPLHDLYNGTVRIPRPAVPRFFEVELPNLAKLIRVDTEVSTEWFTIEPATPTFRLAVRGSPASLSAILYAEYDGKSLVAGKVADPNARFCLPDPADPLRYFVRSPHSERRALDNLRHFGFSGETGDTLSHIVGEREVLSFIGSKLPTLRRAGWKVELEGRVAPYLEELPSVTPVIRVTDAPHHEWFEIGFDYELNGQTLPMADIQRAILKGESFIHRDGKLVLIDIDAVESMNRVFRDCASTEGSRPGTFRLPRLYSAYVKSSIDALDGVDVEMPAPWRDQAAEQAGKVTIEAVATPAIQAVLRPYQKDGIAWLRFLERNGFCGILADEMGLGKTLQTLAWLTLERRHPEYVGKPALIICPTSLVENWAEEAAKFAPGLRVLCLTGNDRHTLWGRIPESDLVVTSYALIRRDVDQYLNFDFSVLVLDEAQHIKNRSTQNAITAKRLRAAQRLVLTGTPIENSVSDLWSILDFLMPGYLGSHDSFRRHYEAPIAGGGFEGEEAQIRLRRKLGPFMLRRLKADVAKDLPPKIERVALCSLAPEQKQVYRALVESSRRKLEDMVATQGFKRCTIEILKTLLQLRQACCHLDLLKLPGLPPGQPSAKTDLFFELLDEALDGGHRILVFSQFVSMLTILKQELQSRQIPFCYLDGSTKERQKIVHQFNSDREIPLFLISLKAGGTGLNLTGADMVIHYDPWWNPAVEQQATDRAYRIGQKRTVYGIKLLTRGTIEEKVLEMQKRKQAVIDATLSTDESILQALTWEEVQDLLTLEK
ncbi:MAG: SNF2-related protein [Kiritimatiellia bacterium]